MDNINITLQKNSADGQTLCHTAEITGLDPADLLMAVCLNVIRKAREQAQRLPTTPAPAPADMQKAEVAPAPAGTAGMFDHITD